MAHSLNVLSEGDEGVIFQCSKCGATCEFVKVGFGTPNPMMNDTGVWESPSNPEQWMGPCND